MSDGLRRLGVVLAFIPAVYWVLPGFLLGAVVYVIRGREAGERVVDWFCMPLDRLTGFRSC
jgi:hypothetical protein